MDRTPSDKPKPDKPEEGGSDRGPSKHSYRKTGLDNASPYRIMGMGVELVAVILGMTFTGYLIDANFDTKPWGTAIGSMLGVIVGCYNITKEAFRMQKRK